MDVRTSRRTVAGALAVLLAGALFAALFASFAPAAGAGQITRRERLLTLTNDARINHDRARVALVRRLSHYAKHHSEAMASKGYLFHSDTSTLQKELEPYHWSIGGENVGVGDTIVGLQDAFMQSKPHRRNILRSRFDHTAIGIVREGGHLWVTVIFYG